MWYCVLLPISARSGSSAGCRHGCCRRTGCVCGRTTSRSCGMSESIMTGCFHWSRRFRSRRAVRWSWCRLRTNTGITVMTPAIWKRCVTWCWSAAWRCRSSPRTVRLRRRFPAAALTGSIRPEILVRARRSVSECSHRMPRAARWCVRNSGSAGLTTGETAAICMATRRARRIWTICWTWGMLISICLRAERTSASWTDRTTTTSWRRMWLRMTTTRCSRRQATLQKNMNSSRKWSASMRRSRRWSSQPTSGKRHTENWRPCRKRDCCRISGICPNRSWITFRSVWKSVDKAMATYSTTRPWSTSRISSGSACGGQMTVPASLWRTGVSRTCTTGSWTASMMCSPEK